MKVYEELGGYKSLKKAFAQKPEEILEAVKASGLRGRGGAGSVSYTHLTLPTKAEE